MSTCTRISTSVRPSPPRALYFSVHLYSANPQGLHTVCWYSPPRALYFCVLQYDASPNGLCTVRAYKGFVLLCTVRAPRALCNTSLQRLYTVCARVCASVHCTSPKSFVRCEPTTLCASVYCTSPQSFVRCEPTRLCASVCCTSPKSFVRCEPTKALCFCVLYEPHELCAVRAYKDCIQCEPGHVLLCTVRAPRALCGASLQRLHTVCWCSPPGFAPSVYVLVRSYEQMSSCTRTCTYLL